MPKSNHDKPEVETWERSQTRKDVKKCPFIAFNMTEDEGKVSCG